MPFCLSSFQVCPCFFAAVQAYHGTTVNGRLMFIQYAQFVIMDDRNVPIHTMGYCGHHKSGVLNATYCHILQFIPVDTIGDQIVQWSPQQSFPFVRVRQHAAYEQFREIHLNLCSALARGWKRLRP